jgi:hypothetical protein
LPTYLRGGVHHKACLAEHHSTTEPLKPTRCDLCRERQRLPHPPTHAPTPPRPAPPPGSSVTTTPTPSPTQPGRWRSSSGCPSSPRALVPGPAGPCVHLLPCMSPTSPPLPSPGPPKITAAPVRPGFLTAEPSLRPMHAQQAASPKGCRTPGYAVRTGDCHATPHGGLTGFSSFCS